MGKINIIEESRLSLLEMKNVLGGDGGLDCFQNTYRGTEGDNCFGYPKYAYCPVSYYSCNTNGVVSCNVAISKYMGPQGGAGCVGVIDYEVEQNEC